MNASTNHADTRATVNTRIMTGTKQQCRAQILKLAKAGIKTTCRNGGVWVATADAEAAGKILGW